MSSSMQVPSPPIDLGDTYGAFFIGAIFAALLSGLTNIQALIYFRTHADRCITFYKLVVFWLWILDAIHLALIVHCVYYYLVTNYANISVLTEVVWSFKLQIAFNVLIVYTIYLLNSHRIWMVGRHRSRVFRIIPVIIVALGSGVAITLLWIVYRYHPSGNLFDIMWPTFMALGTAASLDMLVASSLCYLLATSRTGFLNTDSWIKKLIGYTIDSGCLTRYYSLQPTLYLDLYLLQYLFIDIYHHSELPIIVLFISSLRVAYMAKLYVNSYIALLNARYYMLSKTDTVNSSGHQRCYSDSLSTRMQDVWQEKLQACRKSVFNYPEHEVGLPTRPVQAAMLHRSILVTVEKDSEFRFLV
ncbi:hypothetical protein DFH29DRAFT_1002886 [Suillus ampliporus]|nr:hypothetical protein DFH29DRAFT_1002886 [Suillus ampliporus]